VTATTFGVIYSFMEKLANEVQRKRLSVEGQGQKKEKCGLEIFRQFVRISIQHY
jgi:hypothetical protein